MTSDAFGVLMESLAFAWSTQDTERALACFVDDAVYMEPPDLQLYCGHAELRPYFDAIAPGTRMQFHALMLDRKGEVGAGEYTFGTEGKPMADHGVVVVEIRDERIAFWREFQRVGPAARDEFLATGGKEWKWHIGNYP